MRVLGNAAVFFAFILVGCQTTITLPDGQASVMGVAESAQRANISVEPQPLPGPLIYKPGMECTYNETRRKYGSNETGEYSTQVTLNSVEDRLFLVVKRDGYGDSTALMTAQGKLLDFNLLDPLDGKRYTAETYNNLIQAEKDRLGSRYSPESVHFVNPLSILYPEFIDANRVRPDQTVSVIGTESGALWGRYIYRGVAEYEDRKVLLLDLQRTIKTPSENRRLLFGYSLIDPDSKTPLYTIMDAGTKGVFEVVDCAGPP